MALFIRLCLMSLLPFTISAQHGTSISFDTLAHKKFLTIVNVNKDQTYMSLWKGIGNQRPILFEAQLSPSYFISSHHKDWAVMINPQVQVRMLNEKSRPIQVPSYHLYLSYYHSIDFWDKTFLRKALYEDAIWFTSWVHHSNGQSGDFYLIDSTKTIDRINGNFSVNFIQLGFSTYTLRPSGANYFSLREIKVHTELYPYGWCDPHLRGNYGFYRLFGTLNFGGPSGLGERNALNRWLQNSSIEIKLGWIFGSYQSFHPINATKRSIIDISYKYFPPWLDEVAFFIRFYRGQDYYNVYFEKQLINLTIGITSNTIKLSNSVRYLGDKRKKRND